MYFLSRSQGHVEVSHERKEESCILAKSISPLSINSPLIDDLWNIYNYYLTFLFSNVLLILFSNFVHQSVVMFL
jgi:hypothetical protein